MKNFQFLEIIIDGILKNELHLKNYLIRKQKEAENKNYFSEIEFYQKCSAVITQLESNIELQFTDRKKKSYNKLLNYSKVKITLSKKN